MKTLLLTTLVLAVSAVGFAETADEAAVKAARDMAAF